MTGIRAFIPSCEFHDYLAVTLPLNRRHFSEVVVVTTLADRLTAAVAEDNGCFVHQTELWTADGAHFNCARAVEQALDNNGRHGWVCQLSADIVLPEHATFPVEVGAVYSAPRRMLEQWPVAVPPESNWERFPYHHKTGGISGYFMLWHADDPHLGPPPWQPVNWKHVGGSDTEFVAKWPLDCQRLLPFDVLHLGPAGQDWCGRVQPYADGTIPEHAEQRATAHEEFQYLKRYHRRTGRPLHDHEKLS